MTSIKNDAFIVGTAAVSAAAANVAQQKAFQAKVITPIVDTVVKTKEAAVNKDTYTDFADKIKGSYKSFKKFLKKVKDPEKRAEMMRLWRAERNMAKAQKAKETILEKESAFASKEADTYFAKHNMKFPKFKDKVVAGASKVKNAVKNFVNWKTVGKYALFAAGIATVAVVAKAIYNHYKED